METLIRLSTAHARARLSKNIEKQDADCAVELVQFAYFQKVLPKPKKRKHDGQEETDEEEDVQPEDEQEEEDEQMEIDEEPQQEKTKKKASKRKERKQSDDDQFEFEVSEKQQVEKEAEIEKEKSIEIIKLSEERMKKFRTFLFKEFRKTNAQSLPIPQIYESAEKDPEIDFTKQEIDSALDYMQNELNQVFVSNNIVILI